MGQGQEQNEQGVNSAIQLPIPFVHAFNEMRFERFMWEIKIKVERLGIFGLL